MNLLLHWRWLVLAIAIPISIVIEFMEGETRGLHFLDEIVIDGLVLPVTTWVVLTFAARNLRRQFKREERLEQRQLLMQGLAEHREYDGLVEFIVRFPSTLLPLDHTVLLLYDPEQNKLDFVTHWSALGTTAPSSLMLSAPCQSCQANPHAHAQCIDVCGRASTSASVTPPCCIRLVHEEKLIGVLQLYVKPGKQLETEQLDQITALAPEIASSLTMAIADYQQAEHAYREAQMQERRRIAHELHDTLAQQIFYLHLSLDQLADDKELLTSAAARSKVEALRQVAADVYDQVRNNLSVLRTWEQVDLTEAVSEMARLVAHDNSLAIEIRVYGRAQWLSPHASEHLYGVVREGLNNIVKHARAQFVRLELTWSVEQLAIILSDDGVGFDSTVPPASGHYGLTLMREAVEALQGTLVVESRRGAGTQLRAEIPLRQMKPELRLPAALLEQLQTPMQATV